VPEGTETHDRAAKDRLRTLVLIGCGAAVAIGVFARSPGSDDTTENRLLAKKLVGDGFEALAEGDYAAAREALDAAVREDELFAEALLGRAMAALAVGALDDAGLDAERADSLFEGGRFEPRGWEGRSPEEAKAWGRRVSKRLKCVVDGAKGVAGMTPEEYGIVFKVFWEARAVVECGELQQLLQTWRASQRPVRAFDRAIGQCPQLWGCRQ